MMKEDQKVCKKNNRRAEGEQITAARAKQHEDEEEDTGTIRPKRKQTKKSIIRVLWIKYSFQGKLIVGLSG